MKPNAGAAGGHVEAEETEDGEEEEEEEEGEGVSEKPGDGAHPRCHPHPTCGLG